MNKGSKKLPLPFIDWRQLSTQERKNSEKANISWKAKFAAIIAEVYKDNFGYKTLVIVSDLNYVHSWFSWQELGFANDKIGVF